MNTIKKIWQFLIGKKTQSKPLSSVDEIGISKQKESDIIPGGDIKLEWIRTDAQYEKLFAFAKTFGHVITKSINPIVAIKTRGSEQWRGYLQLNKEPLVFAAWHTDRSICTPRDMVEGMRCFAGWAKVQHGGGFIAVPLDTETFSPNIMARMGFKRCNAELYETTAH